MKRFLVALLGTAALSPVMAGCGGGGGSSPDVHASQLTSARSGWVLTAKDMYAYAGEGAKWMPISPNHDAAALRAVAFSDARHGWAVASGPIFDGASILKVYRTTTGGKVWLGANVTAASPLYAASAGAPAYVAFADKGHGWLLAATVAPDGSQGGELFRTEDDGSKWTKLTVPAVGPIAFATQTQGVLVGGDDRNQVYVTRDAGATWAQIVLTPPADQSSAKAHYDAPKFTSPQDGIMPATYTGSDGTTAIALFATHDGGATWAPGAAFADAGAAHLAPNIDVVNAALAYAVLSDGNLHATQDAGATWNAVDSPTWPALVTSVSFADPSDGWAQTATGSCKGLRTPCSGYADLYRTSDGGRTWAKVTISK